MKGPSKPAAPAFLRPATREWWASVVDRWDLEPHHVRLLTMACVAWDRHEEARALIAPQGSRRRRKPADPAVIRRCELSPTAGCSLHGC